MAFDISQARCHFVRRGRGSRILMSHTSQHRPFLKRIMFWGSFCSKGPGRLAVINGTMNGSKYINTLTNYFLPQMEEWFEEDHALFQHDNAPCHKSRMVSQFLREKNIQAIEWPPYSPDLSPIENLWAILKMKIHKEPLISANQLINRVEDIWYRDESIKLACISLIDNMPRRIKKCIVAKGGPLKY